MTDDKALKVVPNDTNILPTTVELDEKWNVIVDKVLQRERAVQIISDGVLNGLVSSKEISATDIFVEKAQDILEDRALRMRGQAKWAIIGASVAAITFLSALLFVSSGPSVEIDPRFATQSLIAGIVKNATMIGIFLGIEYILISLYRAYSHESTILENRIHSLRLGRLFIYLKYSSINNPKTLDKVRKDINSTDIERVFGWNIETSTAFKDISPELATRSIWSNIAEVAGKIVSRRNAG